MLNSCTYISTDLPKSIYVPYTQKNLVGAREEAQIPVQRISFRGEKRCTSEATTASMQKRHTNCTIYVVSDDDFLRGRINTRGQRAGIRD